jgi:histidinol phosphatase-like enzyme (inositol monophosphatase family)
VVDPRDVALAHRLAEAAGAAILPHFRRLDAIDVKADATPVTVADRAAEEAMRRLLAAERPGDGILGEEYEEVVGEGGRLWVLDPIDGTKAFTAGKPTFTTLIALFEDGVPVLGLIEQPYNRERWVGHDGAAWFNGRPLAARRGAPLERAVLSATAPELLETAADRAAFARVEREVAYVTWGGDAYAYGLLAMGCIDLVVEMQLKPFDLGPLAPIVEGAGGRITDWRGEPLGLDGDGRICAAGDAALHRAALDRLAG